MKEKIKIKYKQKEDDIEWKYKSKIRGLEKETYTLLDAEKQIRREDKKKILKWNSRQIKNK